MGFFFFVRRSSGILSWATTLEPWVIRKITSRFCFFRHSIERSPHFDFRFFSAEINALKNLSESTSYFIVRSAKYSLGYSLLRIVFFLVFRVFWLGTPFCLRVHQSKNVRVAVHDSESHF